MSSSPTIEALIHPIRMRIAQQLSHADSTVDQLAERMPDVPRSSIYRHIRRLHDAGVVEVVSEAPVAGGVHRTYGLVRGAASVSGSEAAELTHPQLERYFRAFMASLFGDFERYQLADENDTPRPITFARTAVTFTDDQANALLRDIRDAAESATLEPSGSLRSLSILIIPQA